jgi:hypothetical protein
MTLLIQRLTVKEISTKRGPAKVYRFASGGPLVQRVLRLLECGLDNRPRNRNRRGSDPAHGKGRAHAP